MLITKIITGRDRNNNPSSATVSIFVEDKEDKSPEKIAIPSHYFAANIPAFVPQVKETLTSLVGIKQRQDHSFYSLIRGALGKLQEQETSNPFPYKLHNKLVSCPGCDVCTGKEGHYFGGFDKGQLCIENTLTGRKIYS